MEVCSEKSEATEFEKAGGGVRGGEGWGVHRSVSR